jgi:integrase
MRHLPAELQPVIATLEWHQVDFKAEMVRLIPGWTKNKEGREFPFTDDLRALLKAQQKAHAELKEAKHITPLVFWRMVADGRGGEKKPRAIVSLSKAGRWPAERLDVLVVSRTT